MNLNFALAAAAVLVVALAFVLWPLVRRQPAQSTEDSARINLEVLRDQQAELETDLHSGILDRDQYRRAKEDLERRVLEEARPQAQPVAQVRRPIPAAVSAAVAIPAFSVLLYLALGSPQALEVAPHDADEVSSVTMEQFQGMTEKLASRLKERPDDWEGWAMLGRAYKALQRYEEASKAWAEAARLKPDDADVLADYAEALAVASQGKLAGEPTRLLERALRLNPKHQKALALSGGAAFENRDYRTAIRHWERLLALSKNEPDLAQALRSGIQEARSRMVSAAKTGAVSGTVSLAPELEDQVQPESAVFIFARPVGGPRMPLAIARVRVEDLPYDFTLDDTMAMTPEAKLSSVPRVIIGARVSQTGSARASSGDLEGFSKETTPGTRGIRVVIDRAVP
ncbi:MAG: c-type cytochrome biogenesis protein CcmI [Burkholderiales bacterium]